MAAQSKGLPELSSPAWFAVLVAALVALALGVYPFVAYPAIRRQNMLPEGMLGFFISPVVVGSFAAAVVALLVVGFSGQRTGSTRSRYAFAALAVAALGIALLIGGLVTLRRVGL